VKSQKYNNFEYLKFIIITKDYNILVRIELE